MSTLEVNKIISKKMRELNVESVFLGYRGFPAESCISVNEEIIHGIPDKNKILREGDIVKIDIGVRYKGYIADGTRTFSIGKISKDAERLVNVTYNALFKAIEKAYEGNRIGDIGYAIESYVKEFNFSPVKDFVGHGVGLELHEEPAVPNYGKPGTGKKLKPGMVLAIEPMINQGSSDVIIKDNGWTAVTMDGSLSAHFEHTVAVTENGPMILTI